MLASELDLGRDSVPREATLARRTSAQRDVDGRNKLFEGRLVRFCIGVDVDLLPGERQACVHKLCN